MTKGDRIGAIVVAILLTLAIAPLALHVVRGASAVREGLALSDRLPEQVPPGVTLAIGDPMTQQVLDYTGWGRELPFSIRWANITGGPATTEAFHARAIDVGTGANIPPIRAIWVGIPVRIIAVRLRQQPLSHPIYVLGVSPKAGVKTLSDLRGKKIAFSPGQAQGLVVLRALRAGGLTPADVTLVDLPTTRINNYNGALGAGIVDVAPIASGALAARYLADWGRSGGTVIDHGDFRDDPDVLYVRTEILQDPAKAAALRAYVRMWARVAAWKDAHPDEWATLYYVKFLGLSPDAAHAEVERAGHADIPSDWSWMVGYQQETIDLLAKETGRQSFDAAHLFDRRFESVAIDGLADYATWAAQEKSHPDHKENGAL
ncbi:MAG: ABC transporter substrate-binding protein [Gluconacetobacter liquefaciens]